MTTRITRYAVDGAPKVGLLDGELVHDLDLSLRDALVLAAAGCADAVARSASGTARPVDELTLLAPVPDGARVFCVGINYLEHQQESADVFAADVPEHPIVFLKDQATLAPPDADILLPAAVSKEFDWEVELGVLIGAPARAATPAQALAAVAGYTVVNDVTARDLQQRHAQWCLGKNVAGSTPVGPAVVLREGDEAPDLGLELHVNGVVKQRGRTTDLIFDVATLISVISEVTPLLPGDLIATGTPSGVGFKRTPPEHLADGDVVEASIEGIGTLRNRVVTGPREAQRVAEAVSA